MSETERKSQKGIAKPRSPAYPGISLEEAITRARQVYTHERGNKAHVPAIIVTGTMELRVEKQELRWRPLNTMALSNLRGLAIVAKVG